MKLKHEGGKRFLSYLEEKNQQKVHKKRLIVDEASWNNEGSFL